jgi:hypothetical protein
MLCHFTFDRGCRSNRADEVMRLYAHTNAQVCVVVVLVLVVGMLTPMNPLWWAHCAQQVPAQDQANWLALLFGRLHTCMFVSWSHATVSLAPAHVCLVCTFLRPSTPCAAPRRVLSHMHARYHRTCGGFRPHVVSTESLPSSSLQCTHVHPLTAHTRTHTHTHTHTSNPVGACPHACDDGM